MQCLFRPLLCVAVLLAPVAGAASDAQLLAYLDNNRERFGGIAREIWAAAELGYQEEESSALLRQALVDEGFRMETGVAAIPTAFIASYGSGEPVIALLAEFDALPGISQSDAPVREALPDKHAGHACGHHLFGAGSTAAAVALRHWLEDSGESGTVRVYGTPAEEGGSGKVYMARAGLFDDVDAVLSWHPADRNASNAATSLANKSAKFRFHGVSAHAAAAPEQGRSALDGVEAMNFMVNQLREHVPQETRIHYVITSGGAAPNVVPDFAEVFYYVRHPRRDVLAGIWERVMQTAEAAALGTGTSLDHEVIHGNFEKLPNKTLAEVMHGNLLRVGGVDWNEREAAYAEKIAATLPDDSSLAGQQTRVEPLSFTRSGGSTDVGDVSWQAPTTGMRAATWVPGTPAHSWQAIAAGGTSIGTKGMLVAAKTLALTGAELFRSPALLAAARREFEERRGEDFVYVPLLGDRAPPLDYRVNP
jgi:aminobenzoyl-glutamate utilization protein B